MSPKNTTGGGKKCEFCEKTSSTNKARRNHKRKVIACRVKRDAAVGIKAAEVPVDSKTVVDLPLHLLEDGWRKCWSKTRSRSYYFNLKTGETFRYATEVVAATGAGSIGEYSEKKEAEANYDSNTEIKQE